MAWDQALLWVAGICGALVTIGGVLGRAYSPIKELQKRVTANEAKLSVIESHLKADMESLQAQEQVNKLLLESMMLLLEHEATGNHNTDLAEQAGKLKRFVYDKGGRLK